MKPLWIALLCSLISTSYAQNNSSKLYNINNLTKYSFSGSGTNPQCAKLLIPNEKDFSILLSFDDQIIEIPCQLQMRNSSCKIDLIFRSGSPNIKAEVTSSLLECNLAVKAITKSQKLGQLFIGYHDKENSTSH